MRLSDAAMRRRPRREAHRAERSEGGLYVLVGPIGSAWGSSTIASRVIENQQNRNDQRLPSSSDFR